MHDFLGLPINASTHGGRIDEMIVVIHYLMFVLFIGWGSFMAFSLFKFHKSRNKSADHDGVKTHLSSYVEGAVALFEVVLLVVFAYPLWAERVTNPPNEKESVLVRVVAEQFAWNIHYPGKDGVFGRTDIALVSSENTLGLDREDPYAKDDIVSINQLNLPVNKPVIIKLSSKDVIHSFSLPLFRVKQDAIPGQVMKVWFQPTMTTAEIRQHSIKTFSIANGTIPIGLASLSSVEEYKDGSGTVIVGIGGSFDDETVPKLLAAGVKEVRAASDTPTEIACAQLCGLGHFRMRGFVTIQTPEEFEAWLKEQAHQPVPNDSAAMPAQ
jgi:cytochrome c oxidase subunit 2